MSANKSFHLKINFSDETSFGTTKMIVFDVLYASIVRLVDVEGTIKTSLNWPIRFSLNLSHTNEF